MADRKGGNAQGCREKRKRFFQKHCEAQNQKGPEAPEKKCSGPFEKRFHGSSLAVFIVEQVALNRHVQNFQCDRIVWVRFFDFRKKLGHVSSDLVSLRKKCGSSTGHVMMEY